MPQDPKWAEGMKKIAPGVFAADGTLHLDAEGICGHFGVPFTRENWEALTKAIVHVAGLMDEPQPKVRTKFHGHN